MSTKNSKCGKSDGNLVFLVTVGNVGNVMVKVDTI